MCQKQTSRFEQLSKISDKNLSREQVKALGNLATNTDKGSNTVIRNWSDYISKLSKILEDTSKFERVNIEEGKAVNHLIFIELILRLLKSLEDQGEISEKEKKRFISIRF